MTSPTTTNEKLVGLAASALGAGMAIAGIGALGVRAACGELPTEFNAVAGIGYLATWNAELFGTTATGCTAPQVPMRIVVAAVLLGLGALVAWALVRWRDHKLSEAHLRSQILARREVAAAREVNRIQGPKVTCKRGAQVRPTLVLTRKIEAGDVAWYLGTSQGAEVWICMEDAVLIIGPPRSGKGFRILTSAIVEAPGAVVTTSSRGDNMEATIMARSAKGPVYLFDPEKVTSRQTTMRWSPIRGCEDASVAKRRAGTLVAGTGLGDGQNKEWAGKAADIMQCLLHAAAVAGVSISELHTWTKSPVRARAAVAILETQSPLGWAPMLQAVLDEEPKSRDSKWFGVSSALSALDAPDVRALFDVAPGETQFDPEDFLRRSGTLYLCAPLKQSVSAPGGVGIFFSLLLDDIAAAAHVLALRSPGGRLDPPCAFILDEIANIHPWGGLPGAMAAGSGEGLQVVAVFQSRNQAREGWGQNGEGTIWESATRKILLGGAADASDLRGLADLLGVRQEAELSRSWAAGQDASHSEQLRERPVLSLDELRRLPEGNALLVAGRARPMLVDLVPWTERSYAAVIHASKKWHKDRPGDPVRLGPTYTGKEAA